MFEMFEALPPYFRAFAGGQLMNQLSFTAFVAFGFQHPAWSAMGLALAVMTATIPAAERESGLLDLLLARPVPRARYFTATLVCLVVGMILIPAAQLLGLVVGLATIEPSEEEVTWVQFLPTTVCMSALFLACGGLTLFFSSGAKRRGSASSRAVGVILVLYVVQAFIGLYAPLEKLAWLSPFHYFRPIVNAMQGTRWSDLLMILTIFAVTTSAAFVRFSRRDI